jgi:hypothetical protein
MYLVGYRPIGRPRRCRLRRRCGYECRQTFQLSRSLRALGRHARHRVALYARLLQRLHLAFVEGIREAAASSDASLDLKLRELTLQHLAVTPGHVAYATPDDLEARSTPAVPRPYRHDPFSCAVCGHKRARSTYVLARPTVDVCTRTLDRRGIAPHRDVLSNRLVGVPSSPILCGEEVIQMFVGLASRRNPVRLAEYGLRVV